MGSVVLSKGRKKSDKVLQLLLLTWYGCHTPTDSALVGCLSWLYMKEKLCAFIFRVAILISPLKVIFFLLSHSSIYCWCTWWYLISIFGFLLNSHTQRRAVFPFVHSWTSVPSLSSPNFSVAFLLPLIYCKCCEQHRTLLWVTILLVIQLFGSRTEDCSVRGLHGRWLTSAGKVLSVHTSNCYVPVTAANLPW